MHWQNLRPPLAPNSDEVKIYENLCDQGPVVMLGMTKELIHLCEYMVDLNPIPQSKPVVKSDWAGFQGLAGTVIGDLWTNCFRSATESCAECSSRNWMA